MTRARQRLTMTTARQRMLYGRTSSNLPSRFLEELPEEPIDWQSKTEPASAPRWAGDAASIDPPAGGGRTASRSYSRPKRDPGFTQTAAPSAALGLLHLEKGDAINHRTFGNGMILSVRPMGNDALLEVAFDAVGTKKLMLKAAGPHITKL